MKFMPIYTLSILEDADFSQQMDRICQLLEDCRNSGTLVCRDGIHLFYEYFLAENARGSVVILHGLSEFTCKHYELTYYLLQQGYHVFLYDQRGHGRSQRLTDDPRLIHADRFSDFTEDLQEYMEKIVLPAATQPLYLYGHSMGGAVSLFYLAEHPDVFQKAVISSPLFVPQLPVPTPLAALSAWKDKLLRGSKSQLRHTREFVGKMPERWKHDPTCSRNKYMMQLRIDHACYQTTPMTAGFALKALYLTPALLKISKKITTPHLLISGGQDTVVKTRPHILYAKRAPQCRFIRVPEGKHAMMCDDTGSAAIHTHLMLDFLKEDAL